MKFKKRKIIEKYFTKGSIYRKISLDGKFEYIRLDNSFNDTLTYEVTILSPIPLGLAVTGEKAKYSALEPKEWVRITLN